MRRTAAAGGVLVLALLAGTSCGTLGGSGAGAGPDGESGSVTVEVRNDHWSDIRVYAVGSGSRHRLGNVASMTTGRFDVPDVARGSEVALRFLLDPIGGGDAHITAGLMVWSGETVEVTVRREIAMTVVSIR